MHCENCRSTSVVNQGVRFYGNKKKTGYKCSSCGHKWAVDETPSVKIKKNVVVTSAVDGSPINTKFLETLKSYCKHNNAELVILPVLNKVKFFENRFPDEIKPYLVSSSTVLDDANVELMGHIKLGTTLDNPLHSMKPFSKGRSVVFGHPQVQLQTLPRKTEKYPSIMATTGTVSLEKYGDSKTANKAKFNHSFSALFIDKSSGNMRHLHYDGLGFYDLSEYYSEYKLVENQRAAAIVTGDEHVNFYDESILEATYGKTGMVQTLKPEFIVRHDVLDCYSISHHHAKNVFTRYGKHLSGNNNIEDELIDTLDFIERTTPDFAKSLIVPSNHHTHLTRWLNEADPKLDMVNAKIYHQLMYMMLDSVVSEKNVVSYADPFALWAKTRDLSDKVQFLSTMDKVEIATIDINNHGDSGINGSRGSAMSFNDLPQKTVIGHGHSPSISKGCYVVGTSSNLRLDYNKGLSSWAHAHCVIYPNGKRQLIFIMDKKWK